MAFFIGPLFDFDGNGSVDPTEFLAGAGAFDENSPLNQALNDNSDDIEDIDEFDEYEDDYEDEDEDEDD